MSGFGSINVNKGAVTGASIPAAAAGQVAKKAEATGVVTAKSAGDVAAAVAAAPVAAPAVSKTAATPAAALASAAIVAADEGKTPAADDK